jgi:hypothetical protein
MRIHGGRLAILALAWMASTGAVGVCKLFRPASPEHGGVAVLIPTNYSDPESTLVTLARGMAGKANGLAAYSGGIADITRDGQSFTATFDPAVLSRYKSLPGALEVPARWDEVYERTFFFNFIQYKKNADYTLAWGPDQFNPIDPPRGTDTALLHRSYKVTAHLSDGSDLIIAVGYADVSFVLNPASRWVIVGWQDRVDAAYGGANPGNPDQVSIGWRRLNLR